MAIGEHGVVGEKQAHNHKKELHIGGHQVERSETSAHPHCPTTCGYVDQGQGIQTADGEHEENWFREDCVSLFLMTCLREYVGNNPF